MQFWIPLKEARMKVSIPDLLEQWYELVEYAMKTLFLAGVSYLVTWCKIFTAPRSKGWSNLPVMIRLLFTVPISNAKLERMFSKECFPNSNLLKSISVVPLLSNVCKIF